VDKRGEITFAILDTEWQPGSDELTAKGSLKRKTIATKYADVIESLYARQGADQ
jgi:long-subunit acyl-CoA synthetase (AMP-forming)